MKPKLSDFCFFLANCNGHEKNTHAILRQYFFGEAMLSAAQCLVLIRIDASDRPAGIESHIFHEFAAINSKETELRKSNSHSRNIAMHEGIPPRTIYLFKRS